MDGTQYCSTQTWQYIKLYTCPSLLEFITDHLGEYQDKYSEAFSTFPRGFHFIVFRMKKFYAIAAIIAAVGAAPQGEIGKDKTEVLDEAENLVKKLSETSKLDRK